MISRNILVNCENLLKCVEFFLVTLFLTHCLSTNVTLRVDIHVIVIL